MADAPHRALVSSTLHRQTVLTLLALQALDVDVLALASQQRTDAPVAKAPTSGGQT